MHDPDSVEEVTPSQALAGLVQVFEGTLYALFDAARSPRVVDLLVESPRQCQSLYEGPQAEELAEVVC